ncbi:hypothetical protein MJO29_002035 [Puccinia striiformis f. sp. tritici]|nr:hypothetical protein Pst134EA_002806 [Puccinia striiformis f. sp. tritici]KAH9464371.1 hypothetical protein Pst134EB_003900 [Puccinia striiformis f. sp. tritici]KAH9472181.1 hypothetical protein Pst134EA_002806 [Puccinia striiformis f. sp. tritici]KAI7966287.1 hypothetical protein MJO29_002035 [Puccinia striiformis f. sp. tritici]KAI9628224.1 hypothetical protein KEM48_011742 [Puccinia striiformis f. sp. tritici PST-130]
MNISLLLIPFIIQYLAMGMDPPRGELASLGHESSIDNRDGISDFSSPPRMVELLPVDQVSIDMPPCNDVSTYGTMIREHDSPYEIPPPEERAMNTYPAGSSVSPDVTITRTRGESSCKKCLMISFGVTLICSLLIGIIMWLVIGIGSV